jgi:hypothetical protein
MRSAFVERVVVGIFAREQISLRSATLRDFLWVVRKRKERRDDDAVDVQLCLHIVRVEKGSARDG